MKYIDADMLIAEIERREKENMYDDLPITIGRYYEDRDLLAFIDSLPEEHLIPSNSAGLEKAANQFQANHSQLYEVTSYPIEVVKELERNAFLAGAKWQANQLLKGSPLPEDTVLFQKGVEEGRRLERDDLALTWEDMAKIDAIIFDVNNEFAVDYSKEIDRQKFYEEVLKRFREIKDEQVYQATKE